MNQCLTKTLAVMVGAFLYLLTDKKIIEIFYQLFCAFKNCFYICVSK